MGAVLSEFLWIFTESETFTYWNLECAVFKRFLSPQTTVFRRKETFCRLINRYFPIERFHLFSRLCFTEGFSLFFSWIYGQMFRHGFRCRERKDNNIVVISCSLRKPGAKWPLRTVLCIKTPRTVSGSIFQRNTLYRFLIAAYILGCRCISLAENFQHFLLWFPSLSESPSANSRFSSAATNQSAVTSQSSNCLGKVSDCLTFISYRQFQHFHSALFRQDSSSKYWTSMNFLFVIISAWVLWLFALRRCESNRHGRLV